MENIFDSKILTIILDERIDTTNAKEVEEQIFAVINENKPEKIILDAHKLEYISSVGLRVVLKIKKTVDDTEVINASLEVYDIFEMTGFTDILTVKKSLREISVDGCEIIGKGGHGTVYRLDGDTILKLYGEYEPLNEIEREISYSKKAFVYGIPTAISFDVVKCGKCYGVVFELIKADTFANRLKAEPEKLNEYSEKYNTLVKNLHETKADTHIFSSTKDLYNKWADDMKKYYTDEEVQTLHKVINSIPDRDTFVHGDIHPKNIMVQDNELLFIDMADLTYGHPIFDYAGLFLTHVLAKPFSEQLIGVKNEIAFPLFKNILKSVFSGKSDEEFERIFNVVKGFGLMKYAMSPAVNKNQPADLNARIIAKSKETFFPMAEKLIGAVDF